MYPAVSAAALRDEPTPQAWFERAASAGFEGIELVLSADGPLTRNSPDDVWQRLPERAAEHGLKLVGLASAAFLERNYGSPEPVDRAAARDLTLWMLDRAAACEIDAILVIPAVVGRAGEPRPRVGYADAYNRTLDALCSLRHEAEARAVTIGLENVWNRFLLSPLEAARLIDEVGSPHVGWYFDVGNVLAYGYPEDWIAVLGRRIVRVHAKDYDVSRPGPAGFCPLGEGSVNWAAVVAALRRSGYDGPMTYEGDAPTRTTCERLRAILSGAWPGAGERTP